MSSSSVPNSGTIFILLPVHNRREITLKFVECLRYQTDRAFELVLIDDGSTDGTAEAVQQCPIKSTILKGNGSLWWGGSLHLAYQWLKQRGCSENDIVLIINDDVTFNENYLANGRQLVSENPKSQIGSVYMEKDTGLVADRGAACNFEKFAITPTQNDNELVFLSTRGLFLKASDFIRSGGFCPKELPHYLSDYEFTFRLHRECGLKMITSEKIPVYGLDDKSGTSSLRGRSPFQAISLIFSERFRDNPIYLSNFITKCFPKEFQLRHKKFVWLSIFKRWVFTWPQPFLMMFLIVVIPIRGIFRTTAILLRTIRRGRYDLEAPEKK